MNAYSSAIKPNVAIVFLLLLACLVHGQYRFTNYDYTHGLQVSNITKIAEDSIGYLWLGSNNGLVRFDGVNFQHFESKATDTTAIYGSEISDIEVAHDGKIWTSFREGGISVYNHKTQSFRSRYFEKTDGSNFPQFTIINICIDSELNKLWMVSPLEGVYVMDMETFESKQVIASRAYREIQYDPSDPNYIYISGNLVKKIDKHSFDEVYISDKRLGRHLKIGNIIYGHDWASNTYEVNLETKTDRIFPTNGNVNRGLMIHNNELWVGAFDGIHIRNLKDESLKIIAVDRDNPFAIANHHITALFKDSKDRIWVGTNGGLSAIIPEHQNLINFAPAGIERIVDILPAETPKQYYTFSFHDNSIKEINIEKQSSVTIHPAGKSKLIQPLVAHRVDEKIWVLFFNGLGYFSDSNKKVKRYPAGPYENLIQTRYVGDMEPDNVHNLWVCKNYQNFIYKISMDDPNKIDTIHFPKVKPGESIKNVHWDGRAIWLGTDVGVCRYDPKTGTKQWITVEGEAKEVFENKIEEISSDVHGNLWILSLKRGAWKCKYDLAKKELIVIRSYTQRDGLPNNRPWTIAFDKKGRVFMGSTAGLAVHNSENDRMVHLNKQYGIIHLNIIPKVVDDKLFIMSKGLSYFDLDKIPLSKSAPKVKIESLSSRNKTIILEEEASISLDYKENDISIDFLAFDLSEGRELSYRHRLHKDDPWTVVDYTQRKAIFNELPPGQYEFEVAAAGNDMQWSPAASLSIKIMPPFWQTWWFRLLLIALIASSLYLLFKYRFNQVKRVEGLKTRMAELENEALRAQMNPHFIFNSLNSIKSFIINNKKEEAADYLTVFSDLIRIVLSNSKKRFIVLEDEIEALDLYMEIENIRLEDKFSVEWQIDKNVHTQSIVVPPLTIQPFVENAIWHGFVHKEGKGNLKITVHVEAETLVIKIKDDGVGRVKSKEIEKKHPRKRSFGIDITEQRMDFGKVASEVIINDLYDPDDKPQGTEVILKMPLKRSISLENKT